jgi:hypothetical protein
VSSKDLFDSFESGNERVTFSPEQTLIPLSELQPRIVESEGKPIAPTSAFVLRLAGAKVFKAFTLDSPKMDAYLAALDHQITLSDTIITKDSLWQELHQDVKDFATQLHIHRKAIFWQKADQAIAAGYTQIVLVGNGYNPMAVALAEANPTVRIICTDYDQDIISHCNKIADELGLNNLDYVHFDCALPEPTLSDVLSEEWDFNQFTPTHFQVEGLSYYLTEEQEADLLDDMLNMHGPSDTSAGLVPNEVILDFCDEEQMRNFDNPNSLLHDRMVSTVGAILGSKFTYRTSMIGDYEAKAINNAFRAASVKTIPTHMNVVDAQQFKNAEPRFEPDYWDNAQPTGKIIRLIGR